MKLVLIFLLLFLLPHVQPQAARTILDDTLGPILDILKRRFVGIIGRTGIDPQIRKTHRQLGKEQKKFSKRTPFFCDTTNGRSAVRPTSVHKLRPGDIDVIAAMGDSTTAANGVMGVNAFQLQVENRGASWSIGGQEDWRTMLTLPNILKEFNPNLYGYSVTDSFSPDRITKFNVADPGARSSDAPHQAQILIQRIKSDPKVNVTHDWKLITLHMGGNDFCTEMCSFSDPENTLYKNHERDYMKALRIFRDNLPRVMVNLVPPPNYIKLTNATKPPKECYYSRRFTCTCLFGWRSKPVDFHNHFIETWQKLDKNIAQRDEFNTETFTVNFQPFTLKMTFPKTPDNRDDYTYMAPDCFHQSQKGHARLANALWNNMLEPEGEKQENWPVEFELFRCPTKKRPYIATRVNSLR